MCVCVCVCPFRAKGQWTRCKAFSCMIFCKQFTHSFNPFHSFILFRPCISNPTVKLECKLCWWTSPTVPNFLEPSEWIYSLPASESPWTRGHVSWHYEPVVMGTSCSVRLMELMAGALFQIPPDWPCEQMMHLVYE